MLTPEALDKIFAERGIVLHPLEPSDPIYSKGPSVFFGKPGQEPARLAPPLSNEQDQPETT